MIHPITAAYIHIPFCRRRCYYCDFPISVLGDGGGKIDRTRPMQDYVQQVCEEIRSTARWFPTSRLDTVFFGGGTPSLLPVTELEKILVTLDQQFSIAQAAEISLEIDPGTFDFPQLQSYQQLGVNRYSLGAQSFSDQLLEQIGRTHRREDIERAIAQLQQAGIDHYSLDLISGLPHQTLSQWEATLAEAIRFSPAHLSCYDLIVEPKTVFDRQAQHSKLSLPSDDISAEMYRLTQQQLTAAGYDHYEISNYARSEYQCRHHRVYWQNQSYYGFGMGAASYLGGKRFTRPRTRREYFSWLETLTNPDNDLTLIPEMTPQEELLETLMLGLRLQEGVNLNAIAQKFGSHHVKKITSILAPYLGKKWVNMGTIDHSKSENLSLTDPEGFLFSNTILAELFGGFTDELS